MKSKVSFEDIRKLKAAARVLAYRGDTTLARRLTKTIQILEQKAREMEMNFQVK